MKRILFSLLTAVVAIPAMAQLDRSVMPEPGPAREPEIANFEEFTLDNGLTVIVVENHKLPRVSIQLSVDYGALQEGEYAGLASLTGDMLSEGTTNRTKEELNEEVDFMGARLSTFSSGGFVSGLSKYTESMTEILADVILNPSFDPEAFDKVQQQTLSGIRSSADDPGALMSNLYGSRIYGLDHAYGEIMTEETVENITVNSCEEFHRTHFTPQLAYMAIVGDITVEEARELVSRYFGGWEQVRLSRSTASVPELPSETYVALIDRPVSVQSEIRIGNRVQLPRNAPDAEAVKLANMILGGGSLARLYLNLREDKSYTYGSYSNIGTDEFVSSFTAQAAVRNEVTDSAIAEMLYEINRIRTELVSEEELQSAKNYLAGAFGRSLEQPQTVASFALNIKSEGLDPDHYNNYLQRLQAVTAEDVRAAAQKYFAAENLTIAVVGKASEIEEDLHQFGEVILFDAYGMPAAEAESVGEMSAEDVLNNYYEAIGGREVLDEKTSYIMVAEANFMGSVITIKSAWLSPDMYMQGIETPMGNQTITVNGESVTMSAGGQVQQLEGEDAEGVKAGAYVFELSSFSSDQLNLLPNLTTINGESAYAVEISEGGSVATHYFSVDSGLLLRKTETQEGPGGQSMTVNTDYSDYQEADGVLVPHTVTVPIGPQSLEAKVTRVNFNASDVTADMF